MFFRKKPPKGDILHGYNLDTWHYLGYTELSFKTGTEIKWVSPVFLFADKSNLEHRSYIIKNHRNDLYYSYRDEVLDPWKYGEFDLYTPIRTSPSRWLCEYMLTHYMVKWDYNEKAWIKSDTSSYQAAVKKQKKEEAPTANSESSVIKVDFTTGKNLPE